MIKKVSKKSLKARKVPSQQRSVETVEAIVEAAARILERYSLSGYTTNAVAERAGISIGSLYQYFPSKDALMAALIKRETDKLLKAVMENCINVNPHVALNEFIKCAINHQLERPKLALIIDLEERRLPVEQQNEELISKIKNILVQIIQRLTNESLKESELACHDIVMMVRGMVDGAGERGELDRDSLLKRVNRAVYGYLFYEVPVLEP